MNLQAIARPRPGRLTLPRLVSLTRPRVGLVALLALAALLNTWNLSQNGYANTYYAAAVRSMLDGWHNFFYASFDPGGLVSVDKPPLALWLQAASAKAFGFSSWSLLLPGALAGVAAVAGLYALVSRYWGAAAGLVAGLALAVSPVSVAVNRDNNPDALFACLLVFAALAATRAVERGAWRPLLLSAVLIGLAFNTKMLVAAVVVPAAGAAFLFLAPLPWRARLLRLAAAGGLLAVVSVSWIVAVDLTPATARPYVGSTDDNSAISLALGYNGLGRINGQAGGTSRNGVSGLGGAFSGEPGPFRLFNDALGDQGAWLIPFAIVGGLSALTWSARRRRRPQFASLVVLAGWFAVGTAVFSYASGIIHTYYVSAMAPATAGLVGAGALALWRDARRGRAWLLFPAVALATTAWLELDLLGRASGYRAWLGPAVVVLTGVAVAGLVGLLAREVAAGRRARMATAVVGLGLAGLLLAPAAWAQSTWDVPVDGVFPGAGPSFAGRADFFRARIGQPFPAGSFTRRFAPGGLNRSPGGGFQRSPLPPGGVDGRPGGGAGPLDDGAPAAELAIAYAKSHGPGSRFTLILSSEQETAPLIIQTGESIAAMGGFTGSETVLTPEYLERLVGSGEARYFLLGGGLFGRSNPATSTIESVCTTVPASEWAGSSNAFGLTLYDCAGQAERLGAAR